MVREYDPWRRRAGPPQDRSVGRRIPTAGEHGTGCERDRRVPPILNVPLLPMRLLPYALTAVLLAYAAPTSAQALAPDDDVPGVLIEDGYDLRLGVGGLNYPSNLTTGDGRVWVTEAGFPGVPPTVREVTIPATGTGTATTILTPAMLPLGTLAPPFTDIVWRGGRLWLSHRQRGVNDWLVGAISHFSPDDPAGTFTTVVTNLPSTGDHSNNMVVFGADGRAYFGQGSATNSGIAGPDNAGWVSAAPEFREFAPVPITFDGDNFISRVPSSIDPDADEVTAPYQPFGTPGPGAPYTVPAATPDAPRDGIVAGNGTVYSFDPTAADATSTLRLEAWGLRNPFGLAFDSQDPTRLFITNNGSDIRGQPGDPNDPLDPETFVIRGSRPIAEDYDDIFVITVGGDAEFFGWPDFLHDPDTNEPVSIGDPLFCQNPALDADDCPSPIFEVSFRDGLTVEPAFAPAGIYVSVVGAAPSTSTAFGFEGALFAAESGSFSPQTGAFEFTGYRVSYYDRVSGEETDFLVNEGSTPEELFAPESFNKPVSIVFMGDQMLIADLGVLEPGINLFQSNTGKVWVVSNRQGTSTESDAERSGLVLHPVRPNPSANSATVAFELASPTAVRVAVYDALGREVAVVAEGLRGVGAHSERVVTTGLPAGVYMVRLETEGAVQAERLTVMR